MYDLMSSSDASRDVANFLELCINIRTFMNSTIVSQYAPSELLSDCTDFVNKLTGLEQWKKKVDEGLQREGGAVVLSPDDDGKLPTPKDVTNNYHFDKHGG